MLSKWIEVLLTICTRMEVLSKGSCTVDRGAPFWGFILG